MRNVPLSWTIQALRLLALFAAVLLVPAGLYGQAAAIDGQIEGTVLDPAGAAVSGATASVVNNDTGLRRSVTTNEAGLYRLPVLPRGTYDLTIESSGFGAAKRTGIVINAGTTATLNVTLSVQNVSTEIQVTEGAPVIEPGRTDVGFTLSSNQVINLPLVSRNPYNFILVQPNVTGRPNTEFGVPRKVNANGFSGRINYQLDGNSNVQTDRAGIRLIPISNTFVGEVQTVSNGFAPEFGNTVGVVFNTITRSGTNDYHGEAAYLFRRTPMSARPALLPAAAAKPEVNVDSVFGNVGGRIKRDKLFFHAAWEKVNRDLPVAITVPPATLALLGLPAEFGEAVPFTQNVQFFLGKIDWQISDSHRLSTRFNGHRNDSPYNNATGIRVVSRTHDFIDRSYVAAAQLVSSSASVVNEFRFQVPYRNQKQEAGPQSATGPSLLIPSVIEFGAPETVGFRFIESTPEFSDNLSWVKGTHSLKAGGSVRLVRDENVQPTFARYTFPSVAAYNEARTGVNARSYVNFTQTVGEPAIEYNHNFFSGYVQDSWKPRPNVTLTYGVRYDLYDVPAASEQSQFEYSRQFNVDRNNIAPRMGVAWAFGPEQRTVVRASAGIFYDPPQTDVYRRALLNNGSPQFFNVAGGPMAAFTPSFPAIFTSIPTNFTLGRQDITTVDPDFQTLTSANFNVSLSRELTSNMGITLTYLFTRGNHLPVYRNINLVPGSNRLADGRPIFDATARVFPLFNNITSAESVGQSTYSGGTATLNRRFARGFELFASYTWSNSIDDAPEQNNIDSGAGLLSDPTNRRRDRGPSLADRRHSLSTSGVLEPTTTAGGFWGALARGNRLSYTLVAYSGDVFNVSSNRVLNQDASTGTAFQRPLYIGRNTYRGPRTVQLDARYSRLFPIRERMRLEFIAESTNLLNTTNVTGVNSAASVDVNGNIVTPPPFTANNALDQRLVQLGIRFQF